MASHISVRFGCCFALFAASTGGGCNSSGSFAPAQIEENFAGPFLEKVGLFNNPVLSLAQRGLSIENGGPQPAGVSFLYELQPDKTYRLLVSGHRKHGSVTLRLRYDDGPFLYRPAPEAAEELQISEASLLEALFYSDQAFGYDLLSLSVEECPACSATQANLRRTVLRAVPELENASGTLAAARLLLDWASNTIDYAGSPDLVAGDLIRPWTTAPEIYQKIFLPNRAGVYCGGAAVFFDKVLKLFHHDSFTINFGEPDSDFTHVAVVVPIQQDGSWRYYLFDPTFNATFRRGNGSFAAFRDLVEGSRSGLGDFTVESRSLSRRDFLVSPLNRGSCRVLKRVESGVLVCSDPEYGLEEGSWLRCLGRNGYAKNPVEAYVQLVERRVFSVGTALNPKATQRFQALLEELEIPFGPAGPAVRPRADLVPCG